MRDEIVTAGQGVTRVFVCGGGHQGLSMAAHLALHGLEVTLWNRTEEHIADIIRTNKIECNGAINGVGVLKKASSDFSKVVSDFVMVTTPSSAHRDVARRIAPYVHKNMVIVLNPGRTFGAIEFADTLKECGVKELPQIAETQTIVYTCRRGEKNTTTILAMKNDVNIAALRGSDIHYIMEKMPDCLKPYFVPVESVAQTSLDNVGMVLHCAPVMMNIGWIESNKVNFKYYYDGISQSIGGFLEKIDHERVTVAKALGYEVESTVTWMKRTYDVTGESIFSCIQNNKAYHEIDAPQSIRCRYIFEDVPNGLVPVESLAKQLHIKTPNINTVIDLACAICDVDFRAEGRALSLDNIRKYL